MPVKTNCNNCGAPFNPAGSCSHCGASKIHTLTREFVTLRSLELPEGEVSSKAASAVSKDARYNHEAKLRNAVTEEALRGYIDAIDEGIAAAAKTGKAYYHHKHIENPYMAQRLRAYYIGQGFKARQDKQYIGPSYDRKREPVFRVSWKGAVLTENEIMEIGGASILVVFCVDVLPFLVFGTF